jgi:sulfite exporter TauE/SafE
MDLWVIFITGLTVGGLTCLAVQGGLLASIIAVRSENQLEKNKKSKTTISDNSSQDTVRPTLAFLVSKLAAYTILGFILGTFGGVLGISQNVQIVMQFAAGLYMVAIALNLLNVHPIFRYAVIQPPRFLTRMVRNQSKSKDLFAPAFLGAMTIFIPCGTTLAMEALAISSANAFAGAAIMFTFVLGTSPLFFGVGWLTSMLGENFKGKFLKIAAIAVLYLGITSINGSLVAFGSPLTLQSLAENSPIEFQLNPAERGGYAPSTLAAEDLPTQNVDLNITSQGYSPSKITVKQGEPVKLNLISKDAYSCASAFRIPSLGIVKNLQPNENALIEFTPQNKGKIAFTCSMGMYTGSIEVI